MLDRLFRAHPAAVGETYGEHFAVATGFGWALLKASLACFVHALVPALHERTASRIIRDLHARMVANRVRRPAPADDALLWIAADI